MPVEIRPGFENWLFMMRELHTSGARLTHGTEGRLRATLAGGSPHGPDWPSRYVMEKYGRNIEPKGKRKPGGAFMKPVQPDQKLAEIIGHEPVPRTDVIRKLWDYIHGHNLQDP